MPQTPDPKKELMFKEIWRYLSKDMYSFVVECLKSHVTSDIPDFHREIYGLLLSGKRLAMAAPRGFAKSYLCSFFYPLWEALFLRSKDICIISASEGLAIEWLRKIKREIETNRLLKYWFGELQGDKWTENHIILNNPAKTNIRARGAGGQIRGFRPDLIILDDIETDESVASEDQRNKLRDWVFKACLNTLLPHGKFVWIGTIISPLALLQEVLDSDNDWEKRRYAAYTGEQKEGCELWPQLWPHNKLQERKKEIGSLAFSSEYLNNPILNETAPIKPHQLRYYTELPKNLNLVIAVDPAYSEEQKADFKVAALVGIDHLHNRYLVSYVRTHAPSGEFINSILNMYLMNKGQITAVGLPKGAGDTEFWNSITNEALRRHIYPPFAELKNAFKTGTDRTKRNKKDRIIAALQPLFENGKYFIHQNHEDARDELLSIGVSRHDDLTDALAYAEQLLVPNYMEPEVEERGRYGEKFPEETVVPVFNYGY